MKNKITLILVLFLSITTFSQTTIFTSGQNWNYYDAGNAPANDAQGDTWIENDFDDSGWASGDAELGYGDGDETTVISSSALTGYFRYTFTASAAEAAFTNLDLEAIRDDGIVVYLNGVEVWRDNMPAGAISYGTFASSTIGGGGESTWITNSITNSLVVGSNVLAIEVHQRSSGSSDISFDFRLFGTTVSEENYIIAGDVWSYYDNSQEPPNDGEGDTWKENAFDDTITGWSSGAAELGYGDTQVTLLNSATEVAYFRKTFNVTDASVYNSLDLEAIRDDGMIVYINGIEVWRNNMDPGAVNYSTFANSVVAGSGE
ncbi:MAG: hypothetical protein ACC656_14930, partial [Candidatus Heimdallarchaeota archaeon]